MKILMLAYPDMTLLDLVGPMQAWAFWPGAERQLVWKQPGHVMTDAGAAIVAGHGFAEAYETPDILFVPGGMATRKIIQDEEVVDFVKERGAGAGWVTSVCTGALILGAAGLLQGYRATTHWAAMEYLEMFAATATQKRWVMDRNRVTGGGVTAGIDFGLALMAKIAGPEIAKAVQLAMEYAPAPPFDAGTPETAGPEIVALVEKIFAEQTARSEAT